MLRAHGRPILVTGSHRSGSTWVGQMLASHPRAGYVHEPFNPGLHPDCPVPHMWHHVTELDEERFLAYVRPHLRFRHSWWRDFRAYPGPRRLVGSTLRCLQARWRRLSGARPVMKDPMAFFSAEWLARAFDMDVVLLVRHPAAFAGSLKRVGWAVPFRIFLDQPRLLAAYLAPFEDDMRRLAAAPVDIIEHAILFWRVVHATALRYRARHPGWTFVRHEDLSLDPEAGFRALLAGLGLGFPARVRRTIAAFTARENARDAPPGVADYLCRDSRANVWNWAHRLTPGEVARIRRGTEDLAPAFYPERDWWRGLPASAPGAGAPARWRAAA